MSISRGREPPKVNGQTFGSMPGSYQRRHAASGRLNVNTRVVRFGPRNRTGALIDPSHPKWRRPLQESKRPPSQRPIGRLGVHLASKTHHFVGCFQRLSRVRAIESSRLMERAMGIEPTSEAWEASVARSRKAGSKLDQKRRNPRNLALSLIAVKSLQRRCQSVHSLVSEFRRSNPGTTREQ
jgi:hypothetical protein